MYIFDEHRNVRRYIPPDFYEELISSQKGKSLIGMSLYQISGEYIDKRIFELAKNEIDHGFVYVAEKLWLESFLASGRKLEYVRYSSWLGVNFFESFKESMTFLKYEIQRGDWPEYVWSIDLMSKELGLNFKELNYDSFDFPDEFEVLILGSSENLSAGHMVSAYEYLHDFEYMLERLSNRLKFEESAYVESIEVITDENSYFWTLNLADSGGVWDVWLNNRK